MAEIFEIVDEDDQVVGRAPRSECHGNPNLIHRAVHVLVVDGRGRLLLQKRSGSKDVQPGKWDTSVGGHLEPGESYREAACREMEEELGISSVPLTYLYSSRIRNEIESENISTFLARYEGPLIPAPGEIDEVRYWEPAEIEESLGRGIFTPNFEEEWDSWCRWNRLYPALAEEKIRFCAGDSFPDLLMRLREDEK